MGLLKVKLLANHILNPPNLNDEKILRDSLTLLPKPIFPYDSENSASDLFLSLSHQFKRSWLKSISITGQQWVVCQMILRTLVYLQTKENSI